MVSPVFHFNNELAKRELVVNSNGKPLFFSAIPKYVGATLDKFLTFRLQLMESLAQ